MKPLLSVGALLLVVLIATSLRYPYVDLSQLLGSGEKASSADQKSGKPAADDDVQPVDQECEAVCQLRHFLGLPGFADGLPLYRPPYLAAKPPRSCVPESSALTDADCLDGTFTTDDPRCARARAAKSASGPGHSADELQSWLKHHREDRKRLESACDGFRIAAEAQYALRFLIATVPDPRETPLSFRFDQYVREIGRAAENAGFVLDRFYNPWLGRKADSFYRKHPGALLFRHDRELLLVLLVGETPTGGVNRFALKNALDLVAAMEEQLALETQYSTGARTLPLTILGPQFSGSTESLVVELREWLDGIASARDTRSVDDANDGKAKANAVDRSGQRPLADDDPLSFPWQFTRAQLRFISGAATAASNKQTLERLRRSDGEMRVEVEFSTTARTDSDLFEALGDQLWKSHHGKVALFFESTTLYGSSSERDKADQQHAACGRLPTGALCLPFPMGLQWIRSVYAARGDGTSHPPSIHNVLPLHLDQENQSTDVMPPMAGASTAIDDLVLGQEMQILVDEDIRYVGIVATDPRDVIFLAKHIKEYLPDVTLFTTSSDVLFLHEDAHLEGMYVASTYPLLSWNQAWLADGEGDNRIVFASGSGEGVYNAASLAIAELSPTAQLKLLEYKEPLAPKSTSAMPIGWSYPPVWITKVGNGEFLPVEATSKHDESKDQLERLPIDRHPDLPAERTAGYEEMARHQELSLDAMLLALLLASVLVCNGISVYRRPPSDDASPSSLGGWSQLFTLHHSANVADGWLQVTALLVGNLALGTLMYEAMRLPYVLPGGVSRMQRVELWIAAIGAGVCGAALFFIVGRLLERTAYPLALVGFVAGALLPLGLAKLLGAPDSNGSIFMWLRWAQPSGGASPLLPLALLSIALFLWPVYELGYLQRPRRFDELWRAPAPKEWLPAKADADVLREFEALTTEARQWTGGLKDRLSHLILFVPPLLLWIWAFATCGETSIGRVILWLAMLAGTLLVYVAMLRFAAIAARLRGLLHALAEHRLVRAFDRVRPSLLYSFIDPWAEDAVEPRKESSSSDSTDAKPLTPQEEADDQSALRLTTALAFAFAQLLTLMAFATSALLALVAAAACYPLNCSQSLITFVWLTALATVVVVTAMLVRFLRSNVIQRIARNREGKPELAGRNLQSLTTYGVMPIIAILALRFPALATFFTSWVKPLAGLFHHD